MNVEQRPMLPENPSSINEHAGCNDFSFSSIIFHPINEFLLLSNRMERSVWQIELTANENRLLFVFSRHNRPSLSPRHQRIHHHNNENTPTPRRFPMNNWAQRDLLSLSELLLHQRRCPSLPLHRTHDYHVLATIRCRRPYLWQLDL